MNGGEGQATLTGLALSSGSGLDGGGGGRAWWEEKKTCLQKYFGLNCINILQFTLTDHHVQPLSGSTALFKLKL